MNQAGGYGVVYDEGEEPDREDPEGWRLSWDYNSRFRRPLCFRVPSGKVVSVRQLASSKDNSVLQSDPIDSSVTVWDSALVAACVLCKRSALIQGKRVLELGSGTGLLGCVCAALGAELVVMTDLAGVCPRLKQVIQGHQFLCRVGCDDTRVDNQESFNGSVVCSPLTWGDSKAAKAVLKVRWRGVVSTLPYGVSLPSQEHFKGKWPELVICTDCIYRFRTWRCLRTSCLLTLLVEGKAFLKF
eukprot:765196-Hanusia_phi.AAC.2